MTDAPLRDQILAKLTVLHHATMVDESSAHMREALPIHFFQPRFETKNGDNNDILFKYSVFQTRGPILAAELGTALGKAGFVQESREDMHQIYGSTACCTTHTGALPIAPETLAALDKVAETIIEIDTDRTLTHHFGRMAALAALPGMKRNVAVGVVNTACARISKGFGSHGGG